MFVPQVTPKPGAHGLLGPLVTQRVGLACKPAHGFVTETVGPIAKVPA